MSDGRHAGYGKDIAPEWRAHEVARLRQLREAAGGRVPAAELRRVAERLNLSVKQVRRLVDDPAMGTRRAKGYVADDTVLRAVVATGNAVNAHAYLSKEGLFEGSVRTLQRGLQRAPVPLTSGARHGAQAYMGDRLWLPHLYGDRMSVVAMDHKHVPVLVRKDKRHKPSFPWLTTLIEVRHRVVLASALTVETPGTDTAAATFAEGVAGQYAEDGTWFGGKPGVFLTDNGRDFQAEAVGERLAVAGVLREFTVPFGSRMNAELERWHETVEAEQFKQEPGYHEGDLDEDKKSRFGRKYPDQFCEWDPFVRRLRAWIRHYNEDRPHSSLDGLTPVGSFAADPTPLERVSKESVRLLMLTKADATVNPAGIRHDGVDYMADELVDLVRDTVTIGYLPNVRHYIEVFVAGKHLCTAYPSKHLDAEQRQKVRTATVRQTTQVLANEEAGRALRLERAAKRDAELAAQDRADAERHLGDGPATEPGTPAAGDPDAGTPPAAVSPDAALARLVEEDRTARREKTRRPAGTKQDQADEDALLDRYLAGRAPGDGPRLTVVRDLPEDDR